MTRRRKRVLGAVLAVQLTVAAGVAAGFPGGHGGSAPAPAAPAGSVAVRLRPAPQEPVGSRDAAVRSLLAARGTAVLHHDRAAFLATVDPRAGAFLRRQAALLDALAPVPLASWSYELDAGQRPVGARWAADVTLRYRLAGFDRVPALRRQHLTFVERGGRPYVASDEDPGHRADRDLWDTGPVAVARGARVLVLARPGPSGPLAALAAEADRAVRRVTGVWGPGWAERVVLVVPQTQRELARLVPGAGDLSQVAALETAELDRPGRGSHPVGDRVLINPPVFARLGALGRRVVLTHEITHVASRAVTGAAVPTWLVEGLADYVGYQGVDVPLAVTARELRRDVRAGRLPSRLPPDAAYDGADPRLAQTYEKSWRAVSLLASRYGQGPLLRFYRRVGQGTGPGVVDSELRAELGTSLSAFTAAWRAQLLEELR